MAETKPIARHTFDTVGSRYALEVAFRTMQERCHKLQERLSVLEEENTKLRLLEMKDRKESDLSGVQMRSLKDVIGQLELEKRQLSHHVYMVTSENKHLWNCLSQSKETNKLLGNQLSLISDTFSQHPLNRVIESQINKRTPSILLSHSTYEAQSPVHTAIDSEAKDSLEEISLKLRNSLLQEKSELEDQYAQMVALHDSDLPLSFNTDNLSQSLLHDIMSGENGVSLMLTDIKEYKSSLLLMKGDLINQQRQLQSAIDSLKRLGEEGIGCQTCKLHAADFGKNACVSQETALLNPVIDTNCQAKSDSADSFSVPAVNPKQIFAEDKPVSTVQTGTMFPSCGYGKNTTNSTEECRTYSPSSTASDLQGMENNWTCPMCTETFFSTTFEVFNEHVNEHFDKEDYDFVDASQKLDF